MDRFLSSFRNFIQQGGREGIQSKDTKKSKEEKEPKINDFERIGVKRYKVYEVRVEYTDTVFGTSEDDALSEYKKWLTEHTKGWKIKEVYEIDGPIWS
jgi:hypothetical protein